MVRKFPDVWLFVFVIALLSLSIIMQYSIALSPVSRNSSALWKQVIWITLGMMIMYAACRIPYSKYLDWDKFLLPFSILLLALVLIPSVGSITGGAISRIKFGRIYFQPAELVKLTLVVYIGGSLYMRKKWVRNYFYGVFPHLLILGTIFVLMAKQPDYGTAFIMILVTFGMLFYARAKFSHLFYTVFSVIPFMVLLFLKWPYIIRRIKVFFIQGLDMEGAGYQINQSFIAFGSGGWFGRGLGDGGQKQVFLPASSTDFIFSVIGEELGFVGSLFVIVLFFGILWRGLMISTAAYDPFGMFLAFGLTVSIVFQAVINIGVTIGFVPNTGITLPLVSYGGSSMIVSLAMVGILLNISSYERIENADIL